MSDEDRAERLRRRRQSVRERGEQSEDAQSSSTETAGGNSEEETKQNEQATQAGKAEKTEKDKDSTEEVQDGETRQETEVVWMRGHPEQKDDLEYFTDRLKAEYKRTYGTELEKGRDIYPLVLHHGLATVAEWDVDDLHGALQDLHGSTE